MAHREFRAVDGREWAVWSVQPEYAERRDGASGETVPAVLSAERRRRSEYRVPLTGQFANGWLCFETEGEKRRLAPFPELWARLSDDGLIELCEQAARVERNTRRLVE
ncbi:MAG TPA: hypothetical protein VGM67_03515 [Gemmatimonadaceae bacterium]|jgi:hypothetical protein